MPRGRRHNLACARLILTETSAKDLVCQTANTASPSLSFKGRVDINVVPGAGNGLLKGYALELARTGCAVCVNDLLDR